MPYLPLNLVQFRWSTILIILWFSLGRCAAGNSTVSPACEMDDEHALIKRMMENYNKDMLPVRTGVTVHVELHIQDIPSISELDSDFELDMLFSSIWRDPGLSYSKFDSCFGNITLDLRYLKRIWRPNTCIVNSKSAIIHESPSENAMLIVYKNGSVWTNYRMRVRGPCIIDLRNFPFDEQTCILVFESYSYHSQKVQLMWLPWNPVTYMKKIQLPDFDLTEYPNGLWDELQITFKFSRRYGFFILQAYIPTYMTVFVAWISFWMDPRQISARATLGISSFLAITLQFGNILKNQPRVSYIKALDVWMLGGITFMFASLVELAIISYMQRSLPSACYGYESPGQSRQNFGPIYQLNKNGKATSSECNDCNRPKLCSQISSLDLMGNGGPIPHIYNRCLKRCITPFDIDRYSIIIFPVTFIIFNIFYWVYYLGFK